MIRSRGMDDSVRFGESLRCFCSRLFFYFITLNLAFSENIESTSKITSFTTSSKWVPRCQKKNARNLAHNVLRKRLKQSKLTTIALPVSWRSIGSAARRLRMLSANHLLVNSSPSLFSHSSLHLHLPSV